ncbi:MAG: hypothetical protein PHO62_03960 [Sulfurimonas sp.]|uniref:hypothetical protein n=1 Tax=Sulfurimonas sp. TaxID=2022749 RepID=UPI002605379A|nr:hypothetical protein [Sulfurimonas sp.]MDD5372565.1 hypothetical protein [Sulfurimonas sp.]
MTTIKDYLDYAELAQASYGDLVAGMFGKANTQYFDELTRKDFYGEIKFSPTQATNFANRYKVLAIADPYLTGLDAVLFGEVDENNNLTSKRILSIRGTTSVSDVFSDIILAKYGEAYDQLAALNSFYNQWLLDGIIPIGTKLDVTGHSLGGVLAQSFALAHPNEVGSVYSYNAPGIGGLSAEAYEALGLTSGNIANANITNIYAKEGSEVTSGLGTMIGSVVPISIDNVDPLSNHRIPYTTESLHIYNMLSSIANTQDLNLLTSILEHTSNEKALNIVSDVFQSEVSGSIVDKAIELTKKWSGDATGLTSLVDKTSSQLQSKRVENIYALLNLTPFVIEGDYLPAYANITPDDYSDVFLANRADYLYYTLDKHNRYDVVRGLQDYKDFALGEEYNLSKGANVGKVLFGGDIDNTSSQMQGSDENDYMFGMGGDDTIVGNAGNDYLEGGKGFDTLLGGSNYDTYITDNGDTIRDDLEGKGIVYFEGELLSGGTKDAGSGCSPQSDGSEVYKGDGGEYTLKDSILTFAKDGKILTINDFQKRDGGYIGITLKDNEGDGGSCQSSESSSGNGEDGGNSGNGGNGSCPKPINPIFDFNFSLPNPLQPVAPRADIRDEESTYSGGGGESYTGPIVLDLNRDGITLFSF